MFVTGLRCFRCGSVSPAGLEAYLCPNCSPAADEDPGILDVQYGYGEARAALLSGSRVRSDRQDLFRYLPLLPVEAAGHVLPTGWTPLVSAPRLAARVGLKALYLKDDTRNPTRSLKDRATAIGVTRALALGKRAVYCASAGNAAISLAGFSAHAGLECHVYVPSYATETRLTWLRGYGAHVRVSTGNYDQAFDESEKDGAAHGWYSRNCAFNPYLVEGKKTAALEIAEQLGWQVPDLVIAPVGDGCTLGAIGKGFREARLLGLTDRLPRLVGVQAEAVQPLVRRFTGDRSVPAASGGETRAASIAVQRPRNALRLLAELRESDGLMLALPDSAIASAQRILAEEAGMVAEFTSAATLAGLLRLAEQESLAGRTAVLTITGGRPDHP